MATSVSSPGTNNFPANKEAEDSAKPTFSGKSISIAKDVLLFVVGAVFFPVVSIGFVISEYKHPAKSTEDKSVRILNLIRCFLIPIPILGGIVHIAGQLLHHFKQDSIFAESSNPGFFINVLISLPFLGAGFIASAIMD